MSRAKKAAAKGTADVRSFFSAPARKDAEEKADQAEPQSKKQRVEETGEGGAAAEDETPQATVVLNAETRRSVSEPMIRLEAGLAGVMKPHQIEGLKFMFTHVSGGSVTALRKGSSRGRGCVVAHCMGLGKTIQCVALTHTLLTHPSLTLQNQAPNPGGPVPSGGGNAGAGAGAGAGGGHTTGSTSAPRCVQRIMMVGPVNVLRNWESEFRRWLPGGSTGARAGSGSGGGSGGGREGLVRVFVIDDRKKKAVERVQTLSSWQRGGGVLIIGFDMFHGLVSPKQVRTFRPFPSSCPSIRTIHRASSLPRS